MRSSGIAPVTSVAALLAATISACSLAMNLDVEQCRVDADCTARGPAFTETACVDRVCRSAQPLPLAEAGADAGEDSGGKCGGDEFVVSPDPSKPLRLDLPLVNLSTGAPLTGATIKLCSKVDVACASPRARDLIPDATTGEISVEVEYGFNGYFEVTGPGLMNSLYVVNPPAFNSRRLLTMQVVPAATFELLAATAANRPNPINPNLGHLLVGTRDCTATPVEGLSFLPDRIDSNGETVGYYIAGGLPDPTRTTTAKDGSGGFVNLPAGFVGLRAVNPTTNQTLGSASLIVRAGFLTYSVIMPGT